MLLLPQHVKTDDFDENVIKVFYSKFRYYNEISATDLLRAPKGSSPAVWLWVLLNLRRRWRENS